jgi:peptidyl-prolyl cis-trans isomerase SurA
MKMAVTRFALMAALALGATGVCPTAFAAGTSIKVLVNDEPITNYDIAQRLKMMQASREKGGEKQATELLIDDTLKLQEGKKRGFVLSDAEVDGFFADIARKNKMSATQFAAALGHGGMSASALKRYIKAQATWSQLVKGKTKATVTVKSTDITAAMFSKGSEADLKITEYKLQQIIFVVPKDKSSPAYIAQRRREAEAFRGRFGGCDKSVDLAKQLKDVVVKDIGRRDSSQLNGPLADELKTTAVGKATPPQQTDLGVEIVAVCDTKQVHSDVEARQDAESKLLLEQSKTVGEDYLKQLRKAAIIVYR